MPSLKLRKPASLTRAQYRQHDARRSAAHERALDSIRDGSARSRAIRAGSVPAYLTSVPIPGAAEEIIVWELNAAGDAVVLYLGPLI